MTCRVRHVLPAWEYVLNLSTVREYADGLALQPDFAMVRYVGAQVADATGATPWSAPQMFGSMPRDRLRGASGGAGVGGWTVAGDNNCTASSTSYGNPSWKTKGRSFLTLRPLSKKGRTILGDAAPDGPTAMVVVADLLEKDAVLEAEAPAVMTTPHFDGYPMVLIQLEHVDPELLEDMVERSYELATAYRHRG